MKFKVTALTMVLVFVLISQQGNAQFGINKVQYQSFEWKYMETKNFDIYFYNNSNYLAHFAAVEAEKALQSIQSFLKYRINRRVPLIVYNSHNEFQQTNIIGSYLPEGVGGVTELFKNRVVVPFMGDWEQFRHVIHHELVHAVLNDMFYGGTFQSAMTSGNLRQIPIWMNEGLAEYLSQSGYDLQTDMFMRDMALSENLTGGLENLNGYMAYRGGQTFYWYVAEKYGKERITDLINRLRIQGNLNSTFLSAFNLSFEDFSEQWERFIKKYYWPDIDKFQSAETFSTRITNHKKEYTFYNSSPAISPDGEKMAYISDEGGLLGVYIKTLDKKEDRHEIITALREQDFEELNLLTPGISWNPKGTHLAISAKSGGEDAIYLVDAKNGDYDKLKFGIKSITSVNWSPDGKFLVFIGSPGEQSDIYIYNMDSKKLQNLTNDVFTDKIPVWSNDSKMIYFISDRGENLTINYTKDNFLMWKYNFKQSDIYAIELETKLIKRITNNPQYDKTSIAVSADGNKLLFVSDENGIGNIYEMNLLTGATKPKTNSLSSISQLSLSKDGNKLLFSSLTGGGYDIFLLRFPFDKNLANDTLPLTKFRIQLLEKVQIQKELSDTNKTDSLAQTEQHLTSYGDFQLDLSRQELVKANPDVINDEEQTDFENSIANIEDQSFPVHDYKIKFSTDAALGNPGWSTYYGFQGIAQMLFSDILGDHQIYVQAYLLTDLANSSFMVQYSYLPKIIDYSFSAYQWAGYALGKLPYDTLLYAFRYRNWGASVNASYPLDLFNRFEGGLSWMNVSKENLNIYGLGDISRMLLVPEVRYVHDNTLWAGFGPHQGSRYNIGIKGTPKLSSNSISFITLTGDFRQYIPVTNYMSLALRASGGKSFGANPRNFFIGGTENWINSIWFNGNLPFDQPEDFAFMDFPMPLRGWAVGERKGSQYFLTNAEFRFPLFRALLAGPIPVLIQNFQGCIFFDMGAAWYGNLSDFKSTTTDIAGNVNANDLLMSTGIGTRFYMLGIPLKIDIAWRNLYYAWSEPIWMFSLGYDW